MGVQIIETDFQGPLPPDSVGLLFGRSSSTMKGLIVHPGVIDEDYTGIVKVMVSAPRGIVAISPGDRVAQLLLLPSLHGLFPSAKGQRGSDGFGSSGNELISLAFDMETRPLITLDVEGKQILGLLDTGADKSVIALKDWSPSWPTQKAVGELRGLGYARTPDLSARALHWKDREGHKGQFEPYVLELPVSLWGRDLLTDMGYSLQNTPYSPQAHNILLRQGYHSSCSLGKHLQGRRNPITAREKTDRGGLGFVE